MSKKKKLIGLIIGAICVVAAAIVAVVVIMNAQKSDNKTDKTAEEKMEKIIGIWTLTAVEADGIEITVHADDGVSKPDNAFEFKSDRTGVMNSKETVLPFTYDVDKQEITVEQGTFSYRLDGDKLKITADEETMIYTK